MPSSSVDQLAIDLLVLSARFTRLASRESTSSIPRALWRTLAQLDELGPLRVSELAASTHVSQPTATSLLQRLGERGWVERRPDPDDARAVRVSISGSGRAALEHNRKVAATAMTHRLERLDDASRGALAAGLDALRLVLEDASGPATSGSFTDQRPNDERPSGERPSGERPSNQRPSNQRPSEQRPADQRPRKQRPADQRPSDQRPRKQRPADQPPRTQRPSDDSTMETV